MPTSILPRAKKTASRSEKLALRGLGTLAAILLLLALAEIYVDWRYRSPGVYSEIDAYTLPPLEGTLPRQQSADAAVRVP